MIERFYFYTNNFSQNKIGSKKHTADVVVHDMIERIYFYSIIFSQKETGSKRHTVDMVVPAPTMYIEETRLWMNRVLLLQM
jgi:hypothetical protein